MLPELTLTTFRSDFGHPAGCKTNIAPRLRYFCNFGAIFFRDIKGIKKARIKIRPDDIAEINSKKHTIQQCMDIVLGAMAFVLNKKHLETAPGTNERGKRTIAKEKLFNHIIELIKESNGCEVFCICETTPSKSPKDYWITPYRHWKFLPAEFKDQKCI